MPEETPVETPAVETPAVETPATDDGGVSLAELEEMVGRVVSEKLAGLDLLGEVSRLFESNKGDEEGFLSKVSDLIDSKLKGTPAPATNGSTEPRKPKIRVFN